MQKHPFISIVIVNWNGLKFLKKLLPLLENQIYTKKNYEIIVVDNNSTMDSSRLYIKKEFPSVVLIENTRNDGFARGCNLGIKKSKGEYIVLLNNDTEPKKNWLEELVKCAVKNDAGAVVSKLLYSSRRDTINNAGSILERDSAWPIKEIGANKQDGEEFNKVREITAFCGASVLLSRKMLLQIGVFDENFFMYFEDGDLSWRGQDAGWKYYYCPTSVVYHVHSGSSIEHSAFFNFYVARNRLLILLKHARIGLVIISYLSVIKNLLIKPLLSLLVLRNVREQLAKLKLVFKVLLSFHWRSFTAILRRWHLLKEFSLQS